MQDHRSTVPLKRNHGIAQNFRAPGLSKQKLFPLKLIFLNNVPYQNSFSYIVNPPPPQRQKKTRRNLITCKLYNLTKVLPYIMLDVVKENLHLSGLYFLQPRNHYQLCYEGSDHNFTMFFQLELVRIAQTPLPPTSILIEKTKSREATCIFWNIYLFNKVKFPTILKPILVKNKDCDFFLS